MTSFRLRVVFVPCVKWGVFQQTERARAEYSKGQQLMRQWNAEIVEYERMKAYYAEQGQEPPYKTLGAFRREVRKPTERQAPAMKAWKRHYGDQQQYECWRNVVGTENIPKSLAKFQEIKYNRQEEFALLKAIKRLNKSKTFTRWYRLRHTRRFHARLMRHS